MKYILKSYKQLNPPAIINIEAETFIQLTISIYVGIEGDDKGFDRWIEPIFVRCEMEDNGIIMSDKCLQTALNYVETYFNNTNI